MKKKNIRKYILEAIAGLLVIGACLTINELSRREAYADNNNIDWEVSFPSVIIKYSNGQTIPGATMNSIKVKIVSENSTTLVNDAATNVTNSKASGTVNSQTVSGAFTYTLSLTDPEIRKDGGTLTVSSDGFSFADVSMDKDTSINKLSYTANGLSITTTAVAPNVLQSVGTATLTKDNGYNKAQLINDINAVTSVGITTSTGSPTTATVGWSNVSTTVDSSYDPTKKNAQTFTINGTITLPSGVTNPDCVSLATTMSVTVNAGDYNAAIDAYPDDKLDQEVDDDTLGLSLNKKSSFDDAAMKTILKYQISHNENYANQIKAAIDTNPQPKIKLLISADDDSPDSDVKKRMEKAADKDTSGAKIGKYYDLTLTLYIANSRVGDIKNAGTEINLKVKVPDSVKKSTRKYNTVRDHNEDSEVIGSYSSEDTISFKTKYFSDYAISYTDSSSSSSSSSASTPKSNSAIVPGDDGTGAGAGGTDKSKTPKTGDDFNPRIWIYLLIVCATVASAAWILLQDTREDNEKKQK